MHNVSQTIAPPNESFQLLPPNTTITTVAASEKVIEKKFR